MNEVFEPGAAVDGPPVRSAGRGGRTTGTKSPAGSMTPQSFLKPLHQDEIEVGTGLT